MPPCEESRVGTISLNLQIKEREAQGDEVIALGPPGSLWRLAEENCVLRESKGRREGGVATSWKVTKLAQDSGN